MTLNLAGMVFDNRYHLKALIGKGGFAAVYVLSDARLVAKVEQKGTMSCLPREYKAYIRLSGLYCVPNLYYFGEESGYYGLILENVGYNIEEYFRLKKEIVPSVDSPGLASIVADEMIKALKHIHSLGLVHCDVKPANILYGRRMDMEYQLTIVDFGGCWIDDDPDHVPPVGNEYFSSPRQLGVLGDGQHPCKGDDCVSLGYTVVYLAKDCSMAWDSEYQKYSKKKTPEARVEWLSTKASVSPVDLCSGLPVVYLGFLQHAVQLAPDILPNYDIYVQDFFAL